MLDAVLAADPVEDVAHSARRCPFAVLLQVGEGHAVVGEHGVDRVGEGLDDLAEDGGAVYLGVGAEEGAWVNFVTRSMARNMKSFPSARRSSQTSMWT